MKTHSFLPVHLVVIAVALTTVVGCAGQESGDMADSEGMSESETQFESIFNGEDLSNWDGDPRFWSVENGAIVGETTPDNPTESNTFLFWEGGQPDNFEATFQYRFIQIGDELGGNSGFQYRSEQFTAEDDSSLQWRARGHQADLAANLDWATGIHYDEGGRGVLARRGQSVVIQPDTTLTETFAEEDSLAEYFNNSEWTDARLYANQDTMRYYINGQLMHELIDHTEEGEEEGIIAFQLHTGPPMRVEFRDVQLRMIE